MAAVDPQRQKALKIKSGVVKRLAKERVFYEKEAEATQVKINQMKEDGRDEYEVKKMEEVMAESRMMIPDCDRKFSVAYDELSKMRVADEDLAETEEYKAAVAILEEYKPADK